jgi:hypothetical protein
MREEMYACRIHRRNRINRVIAARRRSRVLGAMNRRRIRNRVLAARRYGTTEGRGRRNTCKRRLRVCRDRRRMSTERFGANRLRVGYVSRDKRSMDLGWMDLALMDARLTRVLTVGVRWGVLAHMRERGVNRSGLRRKLYADSKGYAYEDRLRYVGYVIWFTYYLRAFVAMEVRVFIYILYTQW